MSRPRDDERRAELLDALIGAVAKGGIGTRSLRELAEAVGTSHRMLIHHFGSRDELLLAVVEEVERRQVVVLPDLPRDPANAFLAMWTHLRDPHLRPFEGLFFECYGRAVQGEEPFVEMLPHAVHRWLSALDAGQADRKVDRATVRLGLAVMRGLLLDLLATDDEAEVDAAAARFASMLRTDK